MPAPIEIELDSHRRVSAETTSSPAAPVRNLVLLVEDDEPIAVLLKHILERQKWRVVCASDGAECLRLVAAHRAEIALAFIDCTLPDTHGGSLCQGLREAVPGLPILLTSGRSQPGLLELVAADGPAAFLSKPFLPADITRHLQALLPKASAGRVC